MSVNQVGIQVFSSVFVLFIPDIMYNQSMIFNFLNKPFV